MKEDIMALPNETKNFNDLDEQNGFQAPGWFGEVNKLEPKELSKPILYEFCGKGSEIINLTPHVVTLLTDGTTIDILPSGKIARRELDRSQRSFIEVASGEETISFPVNHIRLGRVTNLPDPKEGTFYIVSQVTAKGLFRSDLLTIDESLRDGSGRIIGCRSFASLS
jgi:hypothetical protein